MMRESCFRCPYRSVERYSDIIIGDFWGIEKVLPDADVKDGASVVIENSEKGRAFLADLSIVKIQCPAEKVLNVIKGYVDNMPEATKRMQIARMKRFEDDYNSHSFEEMVSMYPVVSVFQKYKKALLYHLHLSK